MMLQCCSSVDRRRSVSKFVTIQHRVWGFALILCLLYAIADSRKLPSSGLEPQLYICYSR